MQALQIKQPTDAYCYTISITNSSKILMKEKFLIIKLLNSCCFDTKTDSLSTSSSTTSPNFYLLTPSTILHSYAKNKLLAQLSLMEIKHFGLSTICFFFYFHCQKLRFTVINSLGTAGATLAVQVPISIWCLEF